MESIKNDTIFAPGTEAGAISKQGNIDCNCHKEIITDGSGQLDRYLKALDPSFAKIDGRSIEDLLVFARKYADQIRFYDLPECKIDDGLDPDKVTWKEFFNRDMAVIAASIATTDADSIKATYDDLRSRAEIKPCSETYGDLYDMILGIAAKLDGWYSLAAFDNPLKKDLELGITSNLKGQIKKIIDNEEGFRIYVDNKRPLKLNYTAIVNDEIWGVNQLPAPDESVYEGINPDDRILNAILYTDDIFNQFFSFLKNIIKQSAEYLEFALEKYPAHQPHMALFLSFLKIFRLVQDQMNGITGRMLDYYYKDVLRLTPKDSVPDKVHVVFELAKKVTEYDLPKGTALTAGKDASGKDQVYRTSSDIVINTASIKELKTIFIDKTPVTTTDESVKTIDAIYARPIANSKDGFGTAFTDPNPKWPTFGLGNPVKSDYVNICDSIINNPDKEHTDKAKTGFAIASPQLLLQNGKRLITIKDSGKFSTLLKKIGGSIDKNSTSFFEFWLTGEKGWLNITAVMTDEVYTDFSKYLPYGLFNSDITDPETSYFIDAFDGSKEGSLKIYLPVAEQAIVGYDAKIHGYDSKTKTGFNFNTTQPVLTVIVNPDFGIPAIDYSTLSFTDLSVTVKVGSINPDEADYNKWKESTAGTHIPELTQNLDGLTRLVLHTETGQKPSGIPFDPFTNTPSPKKEFYIGSSEVFNKPLGRLSVNIKRTIELEATTVTGIVVLAQSPTTTTSSVLNTLTQTISNSTTGLNASHDQTNKDYEVSVLQDRSWIDLCTVDGNLEFEKIELASNILYKKLSLNSQPPGFSPPIDFFKGHPLEIARKPLTDITKYDPLAAKGYISIRNLKTITRIPGISDMEQSLDMAKTLQIKTVSVSYESTLDGFEEGIDQLFHVYPFGTTEIRTAKGPSIVANDNIRVDAGNRLLPQFGYAGPYSAASSSKLNGISKKSIEQLSTGIEAKSLSKYANTRKLIRQAKGIYTSGSGGNNQYSVSDSIDDVPFIGQEEGMLLIGLENLSPLQTVSMLFQFAEGSSVNEDDDPPIINWTYLTNNEWRPLRGDYLISDDTYGFQTTGIINISIPSDATTNNTIVTNGLIWLCASVTANSERIPQLINVVTNAVIAEFTDNNNDQSHFDNPLASGSISKLSVAAAQINKVQQPFSSFDGKHKEVGKEFYTRVSERLRHKGRAITAWDYEHLVLDRFPSIYKVKALTHTDPSCIYRTPDASIVTDGTVCCGPQIAPGHVLIVPISNLKNRNSLNPLQPKTSRRVLIEIEEYLKKLTSPFVHVHAKNPIYEQIIVSFKVQFYTGTDKGYYLKKLNEEIVHFLTPWAFDDAADVKFGQKIYASSIINFIEKRTYVDFITDFEMGICRNECCKEDSTVTKTQQSDNIFASVHNCADMEHLLEDIADFPGDIIANPSTPRTILVSVPQHIIVPYEAPVKPTPCETKKLRPVIDLSEINKPLPIKGIVEGDILKKDIVKDDFKIIEKKALDLALDASGSQQSETKQPVLDKLESAPAPAETLAKTDVPLERIKKAIAAKKTTVKKKKI